MPDDTVTIRMAIVATSNATEVLMRDAAAMKAATAELNGTSGYAVATRTATAETATFTAQLGRMESSARAGAGGLDALKVGMLGTAGGAGLLVAAIGAFSLKSAVDFQASMSRIQGNTTLTNAQMKEMTATIQDLAAKTGAPLDQLAQGYMRVTNMGFQGADATRVLTAAMESALSTGSNVADVTNTLASVMHAFGMSGSEAAHAMDTLHLAGALGNMTLEEMTQSFGTVASYASALHIPIEDVAAAMATLTRNGLDAATASTQVKDLMIHIVAPSKQARDEIAMLSQTTGVNLKADFTQSALAGKGLFGVLGDIARATNGNVGEMQKLIPNLRGLLGEIVLTGKGANDYAAILKKLNDAQGTTAAGFDRQQKTTAASFDRATQSVERLARAFGQELAPEAKAAADAISAVGSHADQIAKIFGQVTGIGPAGDLISEWTKASEAQHKNLGEVQLLTQAYAQHKITLQDFKSQIADVMPYAEQEWAVKTAEHTRSVHDQAQAVAEATQKWRDYHTEMLRAMTAEANPTSAGPSGPLPMDAAAKAFETGQKQATDGLKQAEEAMAHSLLHGKDGLDQYTAAGIHDSQEVKAHADALLQANDIIARATGDFAQLLKDETSKDQQAYGQKRAALVLAIAHHASGTEELAKQAAAAAVPLLGLTDAGKKADAWLKRLTGQDKPQTPAQYVTDTQKSLQAAFDNAVGQLARDQRSGASGSVLAADRADVEKTRTALNDFNETIKRAQKTGEDVAKTFTSLSDAAQNRATKALQAYALGLEEHLPKSELDQLRDRALTAADGAKQFSDALNQATKNIKESQPQSASAQLNGLQNQDQKAYNDAIAGLILDLQKGMPASVIAYDRDLVNQTKGTLDGLNKQIKSTTDSFKTVKPETFAGDLAAAQKEAASALDKWNLAVLHGAENVDELRKRAIDAARRVQDLTDIQAADQAIIDKALSTTAAALTSFASVVQNLTQHLQTDTDYLAGLIYTKNTGAPAPNPSAGAAGQGGHVLPGGDRPNAPTLGQQAQEAIQQDANKKATADYANAQAQRAQTDAMIIATRNIGDLGTAFTLLDQEIKGDVTSSFNSLVAHFMTGDGSLADLVAGYQKAKAAQDQETQATIDAANAVGDYTTAVQSRQKEASDAYTNSLDGLAEKIHDHAGITQSDIDSVVANKQAVDGWTEAIQKATYLSSSPAQRQDMLNSIIAPLLQARSAIESAQSSVTSAQLTLIAEESAQQVQGLQAIASDIQNQTAVLQASSAVQQAAMNGMVTGVRDQAGIIKAQGDVDAARLQLQQASTDADRQKAALQLKVSEDALAVARATYEVDQKNAAWAVVVARDELKAATDKASFDRLVAQANAAAETAKLAVDRDQLKTAQDSMALTAAQTVIDNSILATLEDLGPDATGYYSQITGLLDTISKDQAQTNADSLTYQQATAAASKLSAESSIQQALDAQQTASDQASASAASLSGQYLIAQLQMKQAGDEAAAQLLATQQTTAAVQDLSQKQQAIIDNQQEELDQWKTLFGLYESGGATRQGGARTTADFFNTRGNVSPR